MDADGRPVGKEDAVKEKYLDGVGSEERETTRLCKAARCYQSSSKKELSIEPQKRNWAGIIISILVISTVFGIVGLCVYLLQPDEAETSYRYQYDFDAIFDPDWMPRNAKAKWVGEYLFYYDNNRNFVQRRGSEAKILLTNETMNDLAVYDVVVSPDFKYALLIYNYGKIYRYSSVAEYSVYAFETGTHSPLHRRPLQYAGWGRTGNQITYVLDSDIYYKSGVDAKPIAITTSGAGSMGRIANGVCDWMYEEEMFHNTLAHWTSTNGTYLAYVTFNDTLVPQSHFIVYSLPYTTVESVNYPKPGYTNPTASVYIRDLETEDTIMLRIPDSLAQRDPILNSVVWASDDALLVSWSNRYQNISTVVHCLVPKDFKEREAGLRCEPVHEERSDWWIQYISSKPVSGPGKTFFRIEEKKQGGNGNFHHIREIDYSTNPPNTRYVTSGNWDIAKIVGYNPSNRLLYYVSTETSPLERRLYSVNTSDETNARTCYTCDSDCSYFDATMSDTSEWINIDCSGPGVPYSALIKNDGSDTTLYESNAAMAERVLNAKLPNVSYETVTIDGELGTYDFQAKVYLPPNLKPGDDVPVLLSVYGGPGYQSVSTRLHLNWNTYLVVNRQIAVVAFDGRGSSFRGSNVMKEVNRRLGTYEIEDQITALKEIMKRHPVLNRNKVGVMGWSYGGYAAMKVAIHPTSLESDLMKCVIAVAPVTNWKLYDSMYTERYMGSPEYNYRNYEESSVLGQASKFKNFEFLLVHGLKDDNVHFENTAELERELVQKGIVHRYQVYTDEAHSLTNDPRTRKHLFRMMTQFLTECYGST